VRAIDREGFHAKTIVKTPGLVRDHLRRVVADLLRGGLYPKAGLQMRAGYVIIRFQHRAGDEASKPPPVYGSEQILLLSYWKLISLPPVIIILFFINQWLGRSCRAFNHPIANRNSTDMEATSS